MALESRDAVHLTDRCG